MPFGDILGGVGSLVGAAGDIYSALNPPKAGGNKPYTGTLSTPQYTMGGGQLQQLNTDFLTGQRRIRDVLGGLRAEVRPGFGRLTETGVNAIRQKAAEAAGNLRAQMGRRGIAGASFAADTEARVGKEYQQAEDEFRARAFQEELAATTDLIDRESASLTAQAQQGLQELGVSTAFLSSVNQVAVSQKQIDSLIAQQKLLEKYGQTGVPQAQGAAAPATIARPATAGAPANPGFVDPMRPPVRTTPGYQVDLRGPGGRGRRLPGREGLA